MQRALLVCLIGVVIVAYAGPTLWLVSTSLTDEGRVFSRIPQWIPHPITLDNYGYAFRNLPLGRWFANSVIVSLVTVALCVAINVPAGYAFARHRFPGDGILFWLTLSSIMVPVQAYLVPMFLLFTQFGLINTLTGLILPFLSNGFGVFLMRQFIMQIPQELEEAAIIDGASRLVVLWRVVIPLITPAIATLVIFRFMQSWNSFAWPLVAASTDRSITLPVGLALHVFGVVGSSSAQPRFGLSMAASFVSMAPAIVVFLLLQRYFVEGMASSGLK